MKKIICALCVLTILCLFLFTIKDKVVDNNTRKMPKFRVSPTGIWILESEEKIWFTF